MYSKVWADSMLIVRSADDINRETDSQLYMSDPNVKQLW